MGQTRKAGDPLGFSHDDPGSQATPETTPPVLLTEHGGNGSSFERPGDTFATCVRQPYPTNPPVMSAQAVRQLGT